MATIFMPVANFNMHIRSIEDFFCRLLDLKYRIISYGTWSKKKQSLLFFKFCAAKMEKISSHYIEAALCDWFFMNFMRLLMMRFSRWMRKNTSSVWFNFNSQETKYSSIDIFDSMILALNAANQIKKQYWGHI